MVVWLKPVWFGAGANANMLPTVRPPPPRPWWTRKQMCRNISDKAHVTLVEVSKHRCHCGNQHAVHICMIFFSGYVDDHRPCRLTAVMCLMTVEERWLLIYFSHLPTKTGTVAAHSLFYFPFDWGAFLSSRGLKEILRKKWLPQAESRVSKWSND